MTNSTQTIIAVCNEKGGTAKTTSAISLAAALGELGRQVLLVDLDGQAACSRWLGVEDDGRLADALARGGGLVPIRDVKKGLSLAPASGKLDSVAHDLRPTQGGQLRRVLAELDDFDFVFIDCPPSLGNRLIGNALLAATHALVPVETSILALDGLKILLTTLEDIRDGFDHAICLGGVLACRHDARTRLSGMVVTELRRALPGRVFETVIRENVRMRECPASGQTIFEFAPRSRSAEDYLAAAREMLAAPEVWRVNKADDVAGSHQDLPAAADLSMDTLRAHTAAMVRGPVIRLSLCTPITPRSDEPAKEADVNVAAQVRADAATVGGEEPESPQGDTRAFMAHLEKAERILKEEEAKQDHVEELSEQAPEAPWDERTDDSAEPIPATEELEAPVQAVVVDEAEAVTADVEAPRPAGGEMAAAPDEEGQPESPQEDTRASMAHLEPQRILKEEEAEQAREDTEVPGLQAGGTADEVDKMADVLSVVPPPWERDVEELSEQAPKAPWDERTDDSAEPIPATEELEAPVQPAVVDEAEAVTADAEAPRPAGEMAAAPDEEGQPESPQEDTRASMAHLEEPQRILREEEAEQAHVEELSEQAPKAPWDERTDDSAEAMPAPEELEAPVQPVVVDEPEAVTADVEASRPAGGEMAAAPDEEGQSSPELEETPEGYPALRALHDRMKAGGGSAR